MQATYETFGCNDGNVFFLGIDKGNTNASVMYFDSIYGIQYPSASGNNGNGNAVHFLYDVQATPTLVIINPDRSIAVSQVYPPSQEKLTDSIVAHGGIMQECLTSVYNRPNDDILSIIPNPIKERGYIHFNLDRPGIVEVFVYDLNGRQIWNTETKKYEAGSFYTEINLSEAKKGFYHVLLKVNGNDLSIKKLIKI